MKISGIIILRNAVKLGYPFGLAIQSMGMLCDEIIALVDPTSEDDTLPMVTDAAYRATDHRTSVVKVVESNWDMSNHYGHTNCEISVQTAKALERATGDWVLSLQADEVLHEDDIAPLRKVIEIADEKGISGIELQRLYFYGSLEKLREDWTLWMVRLFKRGCWKPDVDGAMRFDPIGHQIRMRTEAARIFHYSRVGDPKQIADRVRNLDRFFHAPEKVQDGDLPAYDFAALRKLDTYVVGHEAETDPVARLMNFPVGCHPKAAREYFNPKIGVELYVVRDGIMDFVVRNDSDTIATLNYCAVRFSIEGREIHALSNYIDTRTSIAPHDSRGCLIFEPVLPADAKDDDMVSVDFSRALSVNGVFASLEPITARVADIKQRTCQP